MNSNYICRVCESTKNLEMLFAPECKSLLVKLKKIIPFTIEIDDRLPPCICIECCFKLEFVYDFKLQYLRTCEKFQYINEVHQKGGVSLKENKGGVSPENESANIGDKLKCEKADILPNFCTKDDNEHIRVKSLTVTLIKETTNAEMKHLKYDTHVKELKPGTICEKNRNMSTLNLVTNKGLKVILPNDEKKSQTNPYSKSALCRALLEDCVINQSQDKPGSPTLKCNELGAMDCIKGEESSEQQKEIVEQRMKMKSEKGCPMHISGRKEEENFLKHTLNHIPEIPEQAKITNVFQSHVNMNKSGDIPMAKKSAEGNNLIETWYTCEHCGKSFRRPKSLRRHKQRHLGPRNFKCNHCGKLFRTADRLNNHQVWYSCANSFNCAECGDVFNDFSSLWQHFMWHRDPGYLKNGEGDSIVKSDSVGANGAFCSTKPYLFKCEMCVKTFTTKPNLMKHQRSHLNMRPFKCLECDKSFMSPSALNIHQALHLNPELYKCDECGKSFTRSSSLKNHQALHSNPDLFKCNECGRTCTSSYYLRKHLMIHSNIRPFKCEECGKAFKESFTLREHQALHANPNLFKCNECGKSFGRSSTYKSHLALHSNPNKYKCKECGKKFTRSRTLKNHLALHYNPDLFKCVCGKLFKSSEALRCHQLTHSKANMKSRIKFKSLNSNLTV